jgi:hypothetical protein
MLGVVAKTGSAPLDPKDQSIFRLKAKPMPQVVPAKLTLEARVHTLEAMLEEIGKAAAESINEEKGK